MLMWIKYLWGWCKINLTCFSKAKTWCGVILWVFVITVVFAESGTAGAGQIMSAEVWPVENGESSQRFAAQLSQSVHDKSKSKSTQKAPPIFPWSSQHSDKFTTTRTPGAGCYETSSGEGTEHWILNTAASAQPCEQSSESEMTFTRKWISKNKSHPLWVEGWQGVLLEECRPCPDAAEATCSAVSWAPRPSCCCCLLASSLCSEGPSRTRLPHRSSCPERGVKSAHVSLILKFYLH